MKLILLAATAFIAMPAMAQTSGSTGTSSPTSAGARGDAQNMPAPTQSADPAMQTQTPPPADPAAPPPPPPADAAPMAAPAPAPMAAPAPAPMATGADPVGGYQPTQPAISGGTPGTPPTFRAAPSPSEAYPAPAPLAKYPVCKKGQFDKCMQRGGR